MARCWTKVAAAALLGLGLGVGACGAGWTEPSGADFQTLGGAAAPPIGFLNFCARRPDQCGLSASSPGDADADARRRDLYTRYYWPLAFGAGAHVDPLTPTSGEPAGMQPDPAADASGFRPEPGLEPAAPEPFATARGIGAPARLRLTPALMGVLEAVNLRINRQIRYVSDDRALYGVDDYWTLPLERGGAGVGDCKDYVLEKRRALVAAGVPAADLSIAIVRTSWRETHAILLVSTEAGELALDSLSPQIKPWRKTGYTWLERQAPGRQFQWVKIGAARPFS